MELKHHLLPTNFSYQWYGDLDSTNLEALRHIKNGGEPNCWFIAKRQRNGKGTHGRSWSSEKGNLFASLHIRPQCPIQNLSQLSILASLAVLTALENAVGFKLHSKALCLKWPNDVLLEGGKLCGILLENRPAINSSSRLTSHNVIIGIGINISSAPELEDTLFRPTDLRRKGIETSAEDLFVDLAKAVRDWLTIWKNGNSFETLRLAWMQRSCHIGKPIRIDTGKAISTGRFSHIDETGAMVLVTENEKYQTIASGHLLAG